MNVKDHKEELETLVNGIKQPVEFKQDKKLLEEMYPKENKSLEQLQRAIDEFQLNPKVIVQKEDMNCILYTSEFLINNNILNIKIKGFSRESSLKIIVNNFTKAEKIELDQGKFAAPKHLFKINKDIYVWFTEKIDFNKE